MEPLKRIPLNDVHRHSKARMTDFAGWYLPAWYTSILEEHRAVRSKAGIFDVSNMGRVWFFPVVPPVFGRWGYSG